MSWTGCRRFVFKVAPSGMPQELAPALGRPRDMVGTLKWSEPCASTKPPPTMSRTFFPPRHTHLRTAALDNRTQRIRESGDNPHRASSGNTLTDGDS